MRAAQSGSITYHLEGRHAGPAWRPFFIDSVKLVTSGQPHSPLQLIAEKANFRR